MIRCFSLLSLVSISFLQAHSSKPSILLIYPWDLQITIGGGIMHTLQHAKLLKTHGYPVVIMTHKNSSMDTCAQQAQLPLCYFSGTHNFEGDFETVCKEYAADIVITPEWRDLDALKKTQERHKYKIIFVQHLTVDSSIKEHSNSFNGIDAIIGVNPTIFDYFSQLSKQTKILVPHIRWIAPFWDHARCMRRNNQLPRAEFFKQNFGINLLNGSLICMIANMVNICKNYPLLLAALHELIHIKKRKLQAVLVGDGPLKPDLEHLSQKLGLSQHVFFIGSTIKVPEILQHCDMHVLASNAEGFPLVNLEAACLKKPIIAAQGTGAAHFIKHGVTGLLFKNNDRQDLVQKIEEFLHNTSLRKKLGENAFNFVESNFSNEKLFTQWEEIFKTLGY